MIDTLVPLPYTRTKGVYVFRRLDALSSQQLVNMVMTSRIASLSDRDIDNFHCTVIQSPERIPATTPIALPDIKARLTRVGWIEGESGQGCLLAYLRSVGLEEEHASWARAGAVHSQNAYRPHVTLKTPFSLYSGFTTRLIEVNNHLLDKPTCLTLTEEIISDCCC